MEYANSKTTNIFQTQKLAATIYPPRLNFGEGKKKSAASLTNSLNQQVHFVSLISFGKPYYRHLYV